jgi:hypothetical protein
LLVTKNAIDSRILTIGWLAVYKGEQIDLKTELKLPNICFIQHELHL